MTHTTEQERAEFEDGAWYWVEKEGWHDEPPEIAPAMYRANSKAWYSYRFGGVPTRELKILGPCLMQAARRAPVVPKGWKITEEMHVAAVKVLHRASGVDGLPQRMVDAMLAAAPQPPEATVNHSLTVEAAPVELPEPVAFALEWTFNGEERGMRLYDDETHCRFDAESDGGVCQPLYTEQQVRQLLAAHGIEEQST